MACSSVSATVRLDRKCGTSSSGKLCVSPSDSTMASSVAAACSSKLNVRQNFLRSARPRPRLIRAPNGLWSDELHAAGVVEEALQHQVLLGGHDAQHGAANRQVVHDHGRGVGVDARCRRSASAARRPGLRPPGGRRRGGAALETSADSSAVRAGASPRQNGTVGGVSPASRTRTTPASTLRICHECVPSRKMSPAFDSTAQSSLTEPTSDVVRLGQHAVVAHLRDRPAGRRRRQAGAFARAQLAVDRVVVEVRAAAAATGLDAAG